MNSIYIMSGESIFQEGDKENKMYIILKGSVEIIFNNNGNITKLATLRKGDFFGEMALFRSKPRTATAIAIEETELAIIDNKEQLDQFLINNPSFSAKMVKIMCERLAHTNELLIEKINENSATKLEFEQR